MTLIVMWLEGFWAFVGILGRKGTSSSDSFPPDSTTSAIGTGSTDFLFRLTSRCLWLSGAKEDIRLTLWLPGQHIVSCSPEINDLGTSDKSEAGCLTDTSQAQSSYPFGVGKLLVACRDW
jgi:hypothetical protein